MPKVKVSSLSLVMQYNIILHIIAPEVALVGEKDAQ